MITAERLGEIWPEASRRLRITLEAQGIDRATAEDLVSEAVTRALATGLRAETVDDFCKWAYRVARNLHVDGLRAGARLAPESEAVEHAAGDDVTYVVEQRLLCESTLRWFSTLPASDRRAILAGIDSNGRIDDRREAVRVAVRRHRARARLLKLVGGLGAWVVGVRAVVRTVARGTRTAAAAATPLVVVPAAAMWLAPAPAAPPLDTTTRPVVTAHVARPAVQRPAAPAAAVPATRVERPADAVRHDPPGPPPNERHPKERPVVSIESPPGVGDKGDGAEAGTSDGEGICVSLGAKNGPCIMELEELQDPLG